MKKTYSSEVDAQIGTILKAAGKLPATENAFVRAFFTHAPLADLQVLAPKEAYRLAADAWKFAQTRKQAEPLISITTAKKGPALTIRVLGDDMPFLVDSLSLLMARIGIKVELTLHPILAVARDSKGALTSAAAADDSKTGLTHESLIVMLASGLPDGLDEAALATRIRAVLQKVRIAVSDWKRMSKTANALAEPFETRLPGIPNAESAEIGDFIRWLGDRNFVFLGIGEYGFTGDDTGQLALNPKTALGLFTLPTLDTVDDGVCPIEYRRTPTTSHFIAITKSSEPSDVHRSAPMDMIVLKRFNPQGAVIGETRILGLFTSIVYYQTTDHIPILRRKVARVLERSGFDPVSHNGKSLKAILEFLPRDELFQLSEDALFTLGMGILSLESRPKVRVFTRLDNFERYASALVFIPRERFSTTVREQVERILARAYHGQTITFYTQVSDSPLARVNILIATVPGSVPAPDSEAIENEITELTNVWADALKKAAVGQFGETEGESVALTYAHAFDTAYITDHTAAGAVADIRRIREAIAGDGLALELYARPVEGGDIHLKCYTTDTGSTLSDVVPMLENMGTKLVEVRPYLVRPKDAPPILLRDFVLRLPAGSTLDIDAHKTRLEAAIGSIWRRDYADDGLNGLLFKTGLTAREIDILRVFSRYMRQINFAYGQMAIWRTLNAHPALAEGLVTYFHTRFDPARKSRDAAMEKAKQSLVTGLESVGTLAEDRIIRRMLELMEAAVRTNAYQPSSPPPAGGRQGGGHPVNSHTELSRGSHAPRLTSPLRGEEPPLKPYISVKFLSRHIPELPLPKPYAEIFVYSTMTEGIHLRGDTVARGGLRWSDRPEDFRTEVLGLMKAQMVKNAVIVPSGSKGGFVVKRAPEDRSLLQEEAIRCYKQFLSGLLDITDNIVGPRIMPPREVVRHDEDDPYLVVAADKGTASFSDIANGVSAEYGFWLGDAFASGGSAGYDHKAMGITARGAWISVVRHFREMNVDIAREPFTCVGIGDMSGDVFGNGMLMSKNTRLVAAFNHRHIFIDPTPDAKTGYAERERLFALPRSGWNDYDAKKISKGGGVFERNVKSITLTREMQTALGTDVKSASPDELIQLILKAPVDLLWNGGIGTYVKSSDETHDEVGDRANNGLRINGDELRCKIVGEGGNLGFTQAGRIEYARTWNGGIALMGGNNGGRINTDAIDNSAGVDCSDHEVNIKIALGRAVEEGRLTLAKRNTLLKSMEEEVAHLVLEDNRLQTQALTLAEASGLKLLEPAAMLMQDLERQNFLNREVEFLPSDKRIEEMKAANMSLTRPEFSVLLAYAKLALTRDLKGGKRLDDPYFTPDLLRYFPKPMQKNYAADIAAHRLRREIVATVLTNELVNRLGIVAAHSLMNETGASAQDVIDAYVFVRDVYGIDALWTGVENEAESDPRLQVDLFWNIRSFITHRMRWVLRYMPRPIDFAATVPAHKQAADTLRTHWREVADLTTASFIDNKLTTYAQSAVPKPLLERICTLEVLAPASLILTAIPGKKHKIERAAALYFAVDNALYLHRLRRSIDTMPQSSAWQRQAAASAAEQFTQLERRILVGILTTHGDKPDATALWLRDHDKAVDRYERLHAAIGLDTMDSAQIFVALRELEQLAA